MLGTYRVLPVTPSTADQMRKPSHRDLCFSLEETHKWYHSSPKRSSLQHQIMGNTLPKYLQGRTKIIEQKLSFPWSPQALPFSSTPARWRPTASTCISAWGLSQATESPAPSPQQYRWDRAEGPEKVQPTPPRALKQWLRGMNVQIPHCPQSSSGIIESTLFYTDSQSSPVGLNSISHGGSWLDRAPRIVLAALFCLACPHSCGCFLDSPPKLTWTWILVSGSASASGGSPTNSISVPHHKVLIWSISYGKYLSCPHHTWIKMSLHRISVYFFKSRHYI